MFRINQRFLRATPHNSGPTLTALFSVLCCLQKSRLTAGNLHFLHLQPAAKCTRRRTTSYDLIHTVLP